ncbi:MAG: hypothetical protein JO015_06565 [Verrucomicrobia bacterium]|nr:hypothetical protein [Verrucomicrobiota bacterium]
MSWKRAQFHAESMLANLGAGPKVKGRKDLRGRKLLLVDDEANPYRTMCFTIAAKIVKKRGGDIEIRAPKAGEIPHAEILGGPPEKPEPRKPEGRKSEARTRTSTPGTKRR